METKYRVLVILLILCVIISLLAVPVLASQVIAPDLVTDFMEDVFFTRWIDGVESYSNTTTQLPDYQNGVNESIIGWTYNTQITNGYIYVTVVSNRKPDNFQVQAFSSAGWWSMDYVGSSGSYHQYRKAASCSFVGIKCKATWNSAYYGSYQIASFLGYEDPVANVSSIGFKVEDYRNNYSSGRWEYATIKNLSSASIPVVGENTNYGNTSNYYLQAGFFTISISESQRSYNMADRLHLLLRHTGDLSEIGMMIQDSSGSTYSTVPVESIVTTFGTNNYSTGYGMSVKQMYSTITFDLSGYDLNDRTVVIVGKVDSVQMGSASYSSPDGYHVRVCGIGIQPCVDEVEWYTRFYARIKADLGRIEDEIGQNNILTSESNEKLQDVIDALNKLIESNQLTADQQAAITDRDQQLADDRTSAESMMDEVGSIQMPSVDEVKDVGLVLGDADGMTLLTKPIGIVFNNKVVYAVVLICFSFAFLGYVIFGKR